MSRNGQQRYGPYSTAGIVVGDFTMPRGTVYCAHWHPLHQLAWSPKG
ncbi:hypothetical protein [Streptomyces aurantiogriseus]|nr:hypothetical protein [Streptomyces aurantiogriseus]